MSTPADGPTLLLTRDFPPMEGGVARWMGEFAMRAEPGSLLVSTGEIAGAGEVDAPMPQRIDRVGVAVERLRTAPGLVRWGRRATHLARTHRVPFTWCAHLKPAGYPARWLHARQGIPYGVIFHGTELLLLRHKIGRSRMQRRFARDMLDAAAALVANSRYTAELVRGVLTSLELPADRYRIDVVPLGTDPAHFRPALDTAAVRERYGLDGGPWIMSVARLVAHKGIDTVIQALSLLRDRHPELRYAVVGDGSRRARFEELARELGLDDRVRFLGLVPDNELPAVLNVADIYMHLARCVDRMVEGFGIAIAEASACGVPVVVSSDGGMPDAVRVGETGMVLPPDDAEAVAAAVQQLLADAPLRRRLGEGGRRAVESYFNWDRVVSDLRRIEREALARRRG